VLAVEAARAGRRETAVAVAAAAGVGAAMLVLPGSAALPVAAMTAGALGAVLRR
jgi:hypothetical protein